VRNEGAAAHDNVVEAESYKLGGDYARLVDETCAGRGWHKVYPWAYYYAYLATGQSESFAKEVLAPVLALVQSRRLLTTPVWDGRKSVVAEIPPVTIVTSVVDFGRQQDRDFYEEKTRELIQHLYVPVFGRETRAVYESAHERVQAASDDFQNGTMDSGVARQLRVLATHPRLYHMIACSETADRLTPIMADLVAAMQESHHAFDYPTTTQLVRKAIATEGAATSAGQGSRAANLGLGVRSGGTVADLTLIRDADRTGGLALFYLVTTKDPDMPFPSTERLSVLRYCLAGSPKLTRLMVRIWQLCRGGQHDEDKAAANEGRAAKVVRHRRVIVFFGSPLTQA
jgi:hypothetical protein